MSSPGLVPSHLHSCHHSFLRIAIKIPDGCKDVSVHFINVHAKDHEEVWLLVQHVPCREDDVGVQCIEHPGVRYSYDVSSRTWVGDIGDGEGAGKDVSVEATDGGDGTVPSYFSL